MRRLPAALLAFAAATWPAGEAMASGGLSCTADDAFAAITIESGITRGMGSPVFSFRASALLRDDAVAGDLREVRFEGEHLAQYWLDGEELRLLLYRERSEGTHGFVQVEVRTQSGAEGLYTGRHKVTVFDMTGDTTGEGRTTRGEGAIACVVE